ncbi:hypothetical protein Tco_0711398 [Tanacetum coccineum]
MEGGVQKSFKKLFTIREKLAAALIQEVVEFMKNGEAIIEKQGDLERGQHELFVYETNSENINNTGICGRYWSLKASSGNPNLKRYFCLIDH